MKERPSVTLLQQGTVHIFFVVGTLEKNKKSGGTNRATALQKAKVSAHTHAFMHACKNTHARVVGQSAAKN